MLIVCVTFFANSFSESFILIICPKKIVILEFLLQLISSELLLALFGLKTFSNIYIGLLKKGVIFFSLLFCN